MKTARSQTLRISTPDGVVFDLPLAGPAIRGAALFVDYLVVMMIANMLSLVLSPVVVVLQDIGVGLRVLLVFAIQLLYGMILEWFWGGKTIGKRLFSLRVIDDRGLRLRPSQIVLRNLMRSIDSLPAFYLIAGICAFFNRRCQRLGDLAAGTVVIRTPEPIESPNDLLAGTRFNSFRQHPHLEARLRQLTQRKEVVLAIDALRRRESLDPDARVDVYSQIADHFREKLAFPEESTEGTTDETYLRNVVDTLCRHPGAARGQAPKEAL